ncbi:MAG: peroxiredoxin [marine bacterium B5-7]|nr:MAG: peroxiredoxin [marine bacterium B5-7]
MTIKVGDRVPEATLFIMVDGKPKSFSTNDIFSGKKVVVFALPGAFTPTCSAAHLPGFVAKADEILARGVDSIVCLSVNDAYVMDAWGKQQNAEKIMMVSDGSAEFTRAAGLDLDLTDRGFGMRSDRYAMIVDDGVVTLLNREAPRKLEVSDADSILAAL